MIELSVIIATYNSAGVLPQTLEALRRQTYSSEKMEIICVDGMSSDSTRAIAENYGCIVLDNPKVEQGNAKIIGIQHARGKYVLFVDSDEALENKEGLSTAVTAMKENPNCHWVVCSGYKRPENYPALSGYISDFGDPFSFFIYRFPKDYRYYMSTLRRCYCAVRETEQYIVFDCDVKRKFPLIEGACGGSMIDMDYYNAHYPECKSNIAMLYHSFYLMLEHGDTQFIYVRDTPLLHYSSDTIGNYLKKLRWRIVNNIHYADKANEVYGGRIKYNRSSGMRKYLFIPYSLTMIVPFVQGIFYAVSRKNAIYLLHFILCLYVMLQITVQYTEKILGRTPGFVAYGTNDRIGR